MRPKGSFFNISERLTVSNSRGAYDFFFSRLLIHGLYQVAFRLSISNSTFARMGRREGEVRPGRRRSREGARAGGVSMEVSGVAGSEWRVSDLKAERMEDGVEGEGEHVSGLRGEGEGERSTDTTRDQRTFQMSSESLGPSGWSDSEMR